MIIARIGDNNVIRKYESNMFCPTLYIEEMKINAGA